MNMNRFTALLLLLIACALPPAAVAQTTASAPAEAASAPAGDPAQWAAERARIARQRQEAEQEFAAAQKACWQKFAVNSCLRSATLARRAKTDALRQQEWALDDLQRSQRTQDRLREIQDKQR